MKRFCLFYGLVKRKWFSRLQAKTLFVPEHMFQDYYEDSCKMSKQTLINIARSNGSYRLSPAVEKTEAKVLIIAGEKELRIMKKSAQALHDAIPASRLFVAPGMKHGELSLVYPQQYLKQVKEFFSREV